MLHTVLSPGLLPFAIYRYYRDSTKPGNIPGNFCNSSGVSNVYQSKKLYNLPYIKQQTPANVTYIQGHHVKYCKSSLRTIIKWMSITGRVVKMGYTDYFEIF